MISEPSANGSVTLSPSRTITLAGPSAQIGLGNAANTLVIPGAINESVAGSGLMMPSAGALVLSGYNTFTGPISITNGSLTINGSGQLGGGAYAAQITNNGSLSFYSSANQSLSGTISGVGTLTQGGSGTLTLSGVNTYSGTTTVSAGTLALGAGGSLAANSSVNLAAGATLDVSGLGATATYALGASAILTASGSNVSATIKGGVNGSVSFGSRPITLNFDGVNPSLVISQGTLNLGGQIITVNDPIPLANGSYNLIQVNSGKIVHSGPYTLAGTATNGTTGSTLSFVTNGGIASLVLTVNNSTNAGGTIVNGLRGDYFNSLGFIGLASSQTDAAIDFNWGAALPVSGLGTNYSVRWSGQVVPLYSENYTFQLNASTGARLWVNDKLLVARTVSMAGADLISGNILLSAGQPCNLMVEYLCNGSTNAHAQLAWASASQPWQVVPSRQLHAVPLLTADSGSIREEFWLGMPGTNLVTLTTNSNYPNHPSGRELLTSFESLAPNWTTNLGTRVSGWLMPLSSGTNNYQFAVAASDTAQLWLSPDATTNNKVLIASVPSSTGIRQFSNFVSQQSITVPLAGGQRYFIELLQKASTNSAHFSVAWKPPGATGFSVIPGDFLAPNGLHSPQPGSTSWFDTLASGHPRLLTSQERFAWLRQCIASNAPAYVVSTWQSTSNAAFTLLSTAPSAYNNGGDGETINTRLMQLATAYYVTGNTNFAERAWLELSNVCTFPDWAGTSGNAGLIQGSMGLAMGVGYDWFYDYLTPARRNVLTNNMVSVGLAYSQLQFDSGTCTRSPTARSTIGKWFLVAGMLPWRSLWEPKAAWRGKIF